MTARPAQVIPEQHWGISFSFFSASSPRGHAEHRDNSLHGYLHADDSCLLLKDCTSLEQQALTHQALTFSKSFLSRQQPIFSQIKAGDTDETISQTCAQVVARRVCRQTLILCLLSHLICVFPILRIKRRSLANSFHH